LSENGTLNDIMLNQLHQNKLLIWIDTKLINLTWYSVDKFDWDT